MIQKCEWCGFVGAPIEAHGHGACQRCKNNISPCCEGENVQKEIEKDCLADEHILN